MKELLLYGNEIIKSYGEGMEKHNVLNGISLKVCEGEFLSVMGPSGSGKSTLLYVLSGMDNFDSGTVAFEGRGLSGMGDEELSDMRRLRMGFIFQQPTLLKNLNILDNIILPLMRDNRRRVREITSKAKSLMRQTGIEGLEDREISQVSGGQLQRAGICRALMNKPGIIFGDEPTGALNSKSAQEIMELLQQINEDGTAILLVTHDINVAARTGRVLFMQDGKIVSELKFSDKEEDYTARADKIMSEMRKIGI